MRNKIRDDENNPIGDDEGIRNRNGFVCREVVVGTRRMKPSSVCPLVRMHVRDTICSNNALATTTTTTKYITTKIYDTK